MSSDRNEAPERIWISPVENSSDWPVWSAENNWEDGVEYVRANLPQSGIGNLLRAALNWRKLVQPNCLVNMTPHERELAEAIDSINGLPCLEYEWGCPNYGGDPTEWCANCQARASAEHKGAINVDNITTARRA